MQCSLFLSSFTRCARKKEKTNRRVGALMPSRKRQIRAKSSTGWNLFRIQSYCRVPCNATASWKIELAGKNEKKKKKGREEFPPVFSERSPRNLSPRRVFVYPCALTMAELRNNWVVEHGLSGVEREQGINRLERGKEKVMGARGGVNPEVELNRRRWKSIGRSTSNNSHATSIVATCSVVRSYKISLRGIGRVRGRERKAEERG